MGYRGRQNLATYSYTRSIEDIKTRVKMVSKEGTTLAEKSNSALEAKIGVFQEIEQPDESLTTAQINDLISSILDEKSTPERTLNVEAVGIPEVISGIGVYIIIPELDLSRTFYVDEDIHTFRDNLHTMSLKLNYANDLSKPGKTTEAAASSKTYKVGDTVNFKEGITTSAAWRAIRREQVRRRPGKDYLAGERSKAPVHLIHTDSSSRVYGWVDEGSFE